MFFDLNEILYTSPSSSELAIELGVDHLPDTGVWEIAVRWREFRIVATYLDDADERVARGTARYSIDRVLTREQDLRDGSWSGWHAVPEYKPGCGSDARWDR